MAKSTPSLTSRASRDFELALRDAVRAADGDAQLAAALPQLGRDRQLSVVVTLGDLSGPAGTAALREALTWPDTSQDLRCAALLALAKRCGADASADLALHFGSKVAAVKHYALIGLAGAGDDRAWSEVREYLSRLIKRRTDWSGCDGDLLTPVAYLGRHLDGRGGARTVDLTSIVRGYFDRVAEASDGHTVPCERPWFELYWPDVLCNGPELKLAEPPDPEAVRQWVRHPLFEPIERDLAL
jgi:hypothetical protein